MLPLKLYPTFVPHHNYNKVSEIYLTDWVGIVRALPEDVE
jgi:hypothetical protein